MIEYKVIATKIREAEELMNRWAADGWQVVATNIVNGSNFTVAGAPMIITFGRQA